jgi:signal transduction histidine kinase
VITPPSSGYSSSDNAYIASVNRALLWAVLAAGVVSLVLSAALARRILGPIEALTAAVHRMKRGDLDQRVEVPSNDEIGQLAMAFNEMGASLARTEQLRRNMVTDIAHELRTPLSNIRGYLEALQDGLVEPTRATIDSLYEEAILLNRLVNDLQELALAEARQLRLARQPVALREIVEKAAQAAEHHVNGSGIRMTLDLAPDLPDVEVDAERIGQVLRNLLNNAFAYTPPMGDVRIAARRDDGRVQVSVYNSGPGIDAEHLPNLFERFYRADRSRSRSTGGSGLGLAIVKQLVEAHGGDVWVESAPGQGATFYFTLPLRSEPVAA